MHKPESESESFQLVNPENLPAKEVDSDYLFISEKKALTQ